MLRSNKQHRVRKDSRLHVMEDLIKTNWVQSDPVVASFSHSEKDVLDLFQSLPESVQSLIDRKVY